MERGGGAAVWSRPDHAPGGGDAQVFLACFLEAPPPKSLTLDARRHGVPTTGVPPQLQIASFDAEQAPDFFAGLLQGPVRAQAERELDPETVARLALCRHCVRIQGEIPDPKDLGYLQAAWAVARFEAMHGAAAVLDGGAIRWTAGDELLRRPPDEPFDLRRELLVVFETDPSPGYGHISHTRGMAKFGRPDLVATGLGPDQADGARRILLSIAHALALGRRLEPGELVRLEGGPPLTLQEYRPGENAPELHLNNEGLLLAARLSSASA